MFHLPTSKTARIWAERIAQWERSNAPVALPHPGRRFALPWAISFCPFGAAGSMVDRAITETEQPDYRVCHPPGFKGVLGVRPSPAAYARRQFLCRPPGYNQTAKQPMRSVVRSAVHRVPVV